MHPALTRALATAHIDDLHSAAARWHTVRLARGAAHDSGMAPPPAAAQRSAAESPAWTSCAPAQKLVQRI